MYLYAPPFSIIKRNSEDYVVSDVLGGKYSFHKNGLSKALSLVGKELEKEKEEDYAPLVETGFFIPTKFQRKDYFNYERIVSRIEKDDGKEGDLMNIGNVTFALIKDCPYSCRGCYAKEAISKKANPFFDEEVLNQTMEDISILGANHISISGGEPTLSPRTVDKTTRLATMAYEAGIEKRLLITTGFGLERFAEQLLESPITEIQLSLDGLGNYNDSYKEFKGATKRSLQAIKSCISNGIEFSVNTVISRENINDLSTFIKNLDYIGVKKLRISRIITEDRSLMLDNEESKTLEGIIAENKDSGNIDVSSFLDNCYVQRNYLNCVAGKLYSHIDCFGNVSPCAFFQNKSIGNLRTSSFLDMWNINNSEIRRFYDGKEILGGCVDCEERYHCFGNCFKEYKLRGLKCQKD